MVSAILLRVLLFFSFLVMLFSAFFLLKEDVLLAEIMSADSDKLQEMIVENYSSGLVLPVAIKRMIYKASVDPNVDNAVVLELLHSYLQKKPLDANVWLMGSQFLQRSENIGQAALYLDVAHRLSETNTPVLFKVFNRYLELGLIEQSMHVAHDIAAAKPNEFRRLFFLVARLSNDYLKVVDLVIPKKHFEVIYNKQKSIKNKYTYYDLALLDAIRAKNSDLAKAVWKAMPIEFRNVSSLGRKYIDYLVKTKQYDSVKTVWPEVVGSSLRVAQILNKGESELSPCWQVRETNSVEKIEISEEGRRPAIKIVFTGAENVNFNHLKCLVNVKPNARYKLFVRSKGEGISTLSGPYLDMFFHGGNKNIHKTEEKIGSWSWERLELIFDVPNGVHFAEIRVRRNKTKLLDSKISGTVWFDSFELQEIGKTEDSNYEVSF